MERTEIVDHLGRSLTIILNQEIPGFDADTRILEDLGLDSMRFIELLMSLEDTLGLEVDAETLEPEVFATAGEFADYIIDRLAAVG